MRDKDIITYSAIRTRYHGATNYTGSRISATDGNKRIFVPYDYSKNVNENHCAAAQTFLDKDARKVTTFAQTFFDKDERFKIKVKKRSGLVFNGDYFWTWDIIGEKEN
tara:strand:+ start:777 stop:1100 length:324 start_codon:yes stop_codon:yes gene_type:complete